MPDSTMAVAARADAIKGFTPGTPLAAPSIGAVEASSTESTEVLITQQEVIFSTAAVVGLRREKVSRRLAAIMRRMFAISPHASRPQHCPKRYEFLERALMARELERL